MRDADGFNTTIRVRCDRTLKDKLERIWKANDLPDLSTLVRIVLIRYADAEERAESECEPTGAILQRLKELGPGQSSGSSKTSKHKRNARPFRPTKPQ